MLATVRWLRLGLPMRPDFNESISAFIPEKAEEEEEGQCIV